jgi:hypothetical protein
MRPFCCVLSALLIAGMTPKPSFAESPAMKKIVTDQASFVVYAPEGWTAAEYAKGACRTVVVRDRESGCEAALAHGIAGHGEAKDLLATLWKTALPQVEGVRLREAYASDNGRRIVFDGGY